MYEDARRLQGALSQAATPTRTHTPSRSIPRSGSEPDPSQKESKRSYIWQNAIEKYYKELEKGGYREKAIDRDLWTIQSPEELLDQIRLLQPSGPWVDIKFVERIFLSLNDFAAITAMALGMNGRVAAVIWGSIRLLLQFNKSAFPRVVQMLRKLELKLPNYKKYESQLAMTPDLEDALCDVYTDIILFCAQAITIFRNNPNFPVNTKMWSHLNEKLEETIANLQQHSDRVEVEVDLIRMARDKRLEETVRVMSDLKVESPTRKATLPCHTVPYGLNPQFFHRSREITHVKKALDPNFGGDNQHLRVLAIHGLGGVGKTQVALHYANISLKVFDAIAWIPAETRIKMSQAVAQFGTKLGLLNESDGADGDEMQAIFKVKTWLNAIDRPYLLIFDNVDDVDVILPVWPSSTQASILITTRSSSVAAKRATEILRLDSFPLDAGQKALVALTGLPAESDEESAASMEICRLLGGLPLAIVQISQFIRERGYSYHEFLRLYEKSAMKVYLRGEAPPEYDHTLRTVWEISIEKLPQDARTLQNLLAFFDPDSIPERLLTNAQTSLTDNRLQFLFDEFDFGDAVGPLLKLSLLGRLASQRALTIHRLVQTAVFTRLSKDDVTYFFNTAVRLLSCGFPNTWRQQGPQQGHGWQFWDKCSQVVPHVQWLIELAKKHNIKPVSPEEFADLVFRIGAHLWEREQPTSALSFLNFGLSLEVNRDGPIGNPAVRLLGHVALDIARPRAALQAYLETLRARLRHSGPNTAEVAEVYDSIACAYTEIGNVQDALEYLRKAEAIHLANDPGRMSRTSAIYAIAYLRAGEPNKALDSLRRCWELQSMSEAEVAASRYPKHSGDIVLLARIYHAQGRAAVAQELAAKTIAIRKGILGSKGPRVADSIFVLANMLRHDGKEASAARLLREVIDMSQGMIEMRGHLARALWVLGSIKQTIHKESDEADKLKQMAHDVRDTIEGRESGDEDTEEAFSRLVGYMLW